MLLNSKKCPNCQAYYDPTLKQCPICHKDNELYYRRNVLNNVFFFHPIAQVGLFLGGFAYTGMLFLEVFASLFLGFKDELLNQVLILFFTYLLMFGGLMVIAMSTRRQPFLKRYTRSLDYIFGAAYTIALIGASLIIGFIVSQFYKGGDNTNQAAAESISKNYPILAGFILCFFGPVCEEFTYRVGLYSLLRRVNVFLAMTVTVIVFTLIHFDFTAENMIGELWSLPSYITSGLILTLAYEHRGPACSMTAHIAYNTFAFIMILVG